MSPWILLILTGVFAYLTHDAFSLAAPSLPYSEVAKGMGQDLSYLPLHEQEKPNRYPYVNRLGNVNHMFWVFAILTAGCAVATVLAFLE